MAKPEKLASNQFDHFYKGGYKIGALRHGPGGPMRPEEWIGSMTTRFGEATMGLTTLADGTTLRDSIIKDPMSWLGAEHLETFGPSTELLVKLLDPDQRLPVHYHPNRAFAKKHLSLQHGKTEAWIILEAPAGANVGLGFSEEKSKKDVAAMVEARDSKGLIDSLQKFDVQAGDAILVPSGVPHAIGAGIFVMELQEPTDLSALLEWNDFAVDGTVDGHLGLGFDTVLDALRYTPIEKSEAATLVTNSRLVESSNTSIFTGAADPYFRADYLGTASPRVEAGFGIFLVLQGSGSIAFDNAPEMQIEKGDAVLIPASAGIWKLTGSQGILARPPHSSKASLAI
jgi:mannose-6-phosphate isomerase